MKLKSPSAPASHWPPGASLLKKMKQAALWRAALAQNFGSSAAEALAVARLIRELNDHTRWVRIPLLAAVNSAGRSNVLAWRTGFSHGIDFPAADSSASSAGLIQAEQLLERGEVDAALVVCDDPSEQLSPAGAKAFGSDSDGRDRFPTNLHLAAGRRGFDCGIAGDRSRGAMFRMDGVPLAVRRVIDSPLAADFELLRSLAAEIRAGTERNAAGRARRLNGADAPHTFTMADSILKIAGGTVYDPANGIDGEVRDLWIDGERIIAPPADPR